MIAKLLTALYDYCAKCGWWTKNCGH